MTDKDFQKKASSPSSTEALVRMKNRSNSIMIIGIILSLIAVCGIAWTIQQSGSKTSIDDLPERGAFGQMPQLSGDARGVGPGGRAMNIEVTTYINTDGSVKSDEIQTMVDGFNSSRTSFIERLQTRLDTAVSSDKITQDQADKILAATKEAMDK